MFSLDTSAVAFNQSATALVVTLSPETVGFLSLLLRLATDNSHLWRSNGELLTPAEQEALTEALDLAWQELRTDDAA